MRASGLHDNDAGTLRWTRGAFVLVQDGRVVKAESGFLRVQRPLPHGDEGTWRPQSHW